MLHKSVDKSVILQQLCYHTFRLNVVHGSTSKQQLFFVVPDYCRPISGVAGIQNLGHIHIECAVKDNWSMGINAHYEYNLKGPQL